MAGIIRPWSSPSCRTRRSWRRFARPSRRLSAGIYLNTGSVGPLPAETAAAMAEMEAYERDVGRAHPDYFDEFLARMAEARAGVSAVLGTDVAAVGLTHSTTDAMNAATLLPRLAARWPRGLDRRTSTPAAWGRCTRSGTGSASISRWSRRATTATTSGRCAAFDAAITADTRLVSISHVLWTTGARPAGRGDRRAGPRSRRAHRRRRRPGGGRDRLPPRRPRGRPVRGARPEMAARSGGDGCARGRPGPGRDADAVAGRLVQLRARRRPGRGGVVARRPSVRVRPASTGPRSSGWPARSAGCRCTSASTSSVAAGRRWRPVWPVGFARSPASRSSHPRTGWPRS